MPLQIPKIDKQLREQHADVGKRKARELVNKNKSGTALFTLAAMFFAFKEIYVEGSNFRRAKFAEIDARLAALEARELKYLGAYRGGHDYKAGNVASHAGGLWHANVDTCETPGKSNDWTLAVKSGGRQSN